MISVSGQTSSIDCGAFLRWLKVKRLVETVTMLIRFVPVTPMRLGSDVKCYRL